MSPFTPRRRFVGCLALTLVPVLFALVPSARAPAREPGQEKAERPRLAVLVVFDQLRGDYLTRWDGLFGKGGFHRLEGEGAWFQNCHYPYAHTVTAAGHASLATGCSPYRHGIVANEWYDRAAGAQVNCVHSDRHARVPARAAKKGGKPTGGVAPERLLQPTLADALKEATGGKGRVVALSLKDRSAVLPGGRRPDACYWMDSGSGQFVTSTYYRDRLHPWVEEYNRGRPADRWFGKEWARLRPDLDYARHSGPDDVKGEGSGYFQGRTFPHALAGGPMRLKAAYYGSLYNSPFGNELLLGLVRQAVRAEGLGRRDTPDLLCVSFSSNDVVGHCWGPDSQEVLDTTLRTDRLLEELQSVLDEQVGRGRYVLALSADHGVCPLPEVAHREGKEAARIPTSLVKARAEAFLSKRFPAPPGSATKDRWVEAVSGPWVYLNRAFLRGRGLKQDEVEKALAHWLEQQPGVQAVVTRGELLAHAPSTDTPLRASVRRSFHPDRSGDLLVVVKPYHLLTSTLTGTNHGTPHPYDTHVPLLVRGPGVRPGVRREAVTPQAAAVILARALGVQAPAGAEAPLPTGLFEEAGR